jgi:flavoprotein
MPEHARQANVPVSRVDGNAAAGPLGEILRLDITTAVGTCRHCSAASPLSEAIVERDAEGVIVLCRSCGHTLVTYISRDGRQYLEFAALLSLDAAATT